MPYLIAMGCPAKDFWKLNPYKVNAIYVKATKVKAQKEDYLAWLNGVYVYQAFSVVMANAFSKKGAKKFEYPSEPAYMQEKDEIVVATDDMSEEEKAQKTQMLFDQLHIMQANFELAHRKSGANNE